LRARPALTQSFLHRVLHQHRDELRDTRALVPAGLAEHRVMDLDLIGPVRKLPRQLVGDPAQLLLEYLTTQFLTHRHATAPLYRPLLRLASIVACLTGCVESRCRKFI
jgi:hypothetical protein